MASQVKKLYRSKSNRKIAGVCGGIAEYFGVDPTVVRVVWAVATVLTCGAGIPAYLVAWLLIPEK